MRIVSSPHRQNTNEKRATIIHVQRIHTRHHSFGIIHWQARPYNVPRCQSTNCFSCSSVKKIRMVVGWRRVHAGSHPLNINIGPSLLSEARITPSVDCIRARVRTGEGEGGTEPTLDPGPLAFMMRLLRTSAGEQTVVATVPCYIHPISAPFRDNKTKQTTYSGKASSKVTINIIVEVGCL